MYMYAYKTLYMHILGVYFFIIVFFSERAVHCPRLRSSHGCLGAQAVLGLGFPGPAKVSGKFPHAPSTTKARGGLQLRRQGVFFFIIIFK